MGSPPVGGFDKVHMGAARMMFSLGVVGVAAGAYLAFATVPSFAPYRDRRASAPVVLSQPIQGDSQTPELAPAAQERGDGVRVRPDFEQGTLVVELPRWAQETGSWFAFGRRALQDWNGWIDPESESERSWNDRAPRGSQRREADEQGYSAPHQRDAGDDYGYEPRDAEAGDAPERWSETGQEWAERGSDAAASAAKRAREVARDVEDAIQDL